MFRIVSLLDQRPRYFQLGHSLAQPGSASKRDYLKMGQPGFDHVGPSVRQALWGVLYLNDFLGSEAKLC